jgi:Dna[CI] antecedent, DciA
MEGMRELLQGSLARTLEGMTAEDRLAAAWPVACGKALSERGRMAAYADGVATVEVTDAAWLQQMISMHGQLVGEMARIAGVNLREIHFEVKGRKKKDDRR